VNGRAVAALLGVSTLAGVAGAQSAEPAPPGFALSLLEPAPAGDRFFSVPDARVRGLLDGHAMLLTTFAHRPLRYALGDREIVTSQLFVHADATLALAEMVALNLDFPVAALQDGDGGFDRDVTSAQGDLRIALRAALGGPPELQLGLELDGWAPTGNEDAFAGDGNGRFSPRLLFGGEAGPFVYALALGWLLRNRVEAAGQVVDDGLTFGLAAGLRFADEAIQIGPEVHGWVVADAQEASTLRSSALEGLLGTRVRFGDVVIGAGAGTALTEGAGAAAARFVASLAYVSDERVLDHDGDGVPDARDRCPWEPGLDESGCPPPDRDGDTIADDADRCPDSPGLPHHDIVRHGCPGAGKPPASPQPRR
jgi:hypothetical protein